MTINLTVPPDSGDAFRMSLVLPNEGQTGWLGKLPFRIQSVECHFINDATNYASQILIHGRLSLGFGAFVSVGATVILVRDYKSRGRWTITVHVDEIGGGLELGKMRIAGRVRWCDKDNPDNDSPVDPDSPDVNKRVIFGDISLQNLFGLGQNIGLSLLVGGSDGAPISMARSSVPTSTWGTWSRSRTALCCFPRMPTRTA